MDVKFVPAECKAPTISGSKSFFQYTVIDEASRKRFLHFTEEHNMNESVAALKLAIAFFGYQPEILQTDNGTEFTDKAFRKKGGEASPALSQRHGESSPRPRASTTAR